MTTSKWLTALLMLLLSCFVLGQGCPTSIFPPDDNDDQLPDDNDDDNDDTSENRHKKIFTEIIPEGFQDPSDCMLCHSDEAEQMITTAHYKWEGVAGGLEGYETEIHGKTDLINNFCIAVPSNEARCTQCHAGFGWKDNTFDFTDTDNVDCLVCHDTTGTYQKAPTTAGLPAEGLDLQTIAENVGTPSRFNCGACHFYAGGGDNVKHGDLPSDMADPTEDIDVHMATDGLNFTCQQCHLTDDHEISGMMVHSLDEGTFKCSRCHGDDDIHEDAVLNLHLNSVSCEACHIPDIGRPRPTVVEWYWDEAGEDRTVTTDEFGMPTYDKKKGRFVWDKNVRPSLLWYNGKWERKIINVNDTYESTPVVLAEPVGDITDLSAKLYPFKKMVGRQPADSVNKRLLVPHLFPGPAGDNAYWKVYDWDLALAEGAAYAGQEYSGSYTFVDTVMYLAVSHGVAPKENALGCTDCHDGGIDFSDLGFDEDPWSSTR